MKKSMTCILASVFLLACSKEPPKCSDEKTLSLVRKITLGQSTLAEQEIKEYLKLESPKADGYDEKIMKYSCSARLVIKVKLVDGVYRDSPIEFDFDLPIKYESQLDDNKQHIVSVDFGSAFGSSERREWNDALERVNIQKKKQSAPVNPSPALPALPALTSKSEPAKQSKNMDFLKNYKVSFDCNKAGNDLERRICGDPYLGQLDGLLHATYKSRFDPQFGKDDNLMKKQQREWLKKRNTCTTEECIKQAYQEQIRSLCETPVVYGVYPTSDCDLFVESME